MGLSSGKNIVLLVADDLGRDFIGCYGNKTVHTPHLDRLASEATRFTSAFASTASCSGSRSTIYTGLHTHENGQYGLHWTKTHFQTFPRVDTAPKLFNAAGYLTGIVGKVHVGPEDVYPWTVRAQDGTRDVDWVARQCADFFDRAGEQSFFLTVGYVDPHRDIHTRGGFGNHVAWQKQHRIDVEPDQVNVPAWLTDLPETRQELAEYYKAIRRLDAGIGQVYEALRHRDLLDTTLVVFTSDNGPPFLNSKTTLYDSGVHLPLIIRQPGVAKGAVNPNMVSFIAFLPTFLGWAGIVPAESAESSSPKRLGSSLLSIMAVEDLLPSDQWQQHVYGSHTFHEIQNYWPTRFLRTHRYKYHRNIAWRLEFPFASDLYASESFHGIRNMDPPVVIGKRSLRDYIFRPPEKLYDLEADPHETTNLALDGSHEGLLLECREKVAEWQKATSDLWLFRDGTSVTVLNRYAKDGLEIPERLDFDVDEPDTSNMAMSRHLGDELSFAGMSRGI